MGRIPLSRESGSTTIVNAYWKLSEDKDFLLCSFGGILGLDALHPTLRA